jgi:hypothetical protein
VKDKFEICTYTREGDPIINKVKFNGKIVIIKTNSRKDRYSSAIDRLTTSRHYISVDSVKKINTVIELINF